MPYLTFPDCRVPQQVDDEAIEYRCITCAAGIVFESCAQCGYCQAIASRWQTAFTCGKCERRVEIPRVRSVGTSAKAKDVEGYGYTYPKF